MRTLPRGNERALVPFVAGKSPPHPAKARRRCVAFAARAPKLPVVTISILRLLCAAAASAAALGVPVPSSYAGQIGDDKWCFVENTGGDSQSWDCEFATVEDCRPAANVGNRGFCSVNPTYRPPPPQPPSTNPQSMTPQPLLPPPRN